MRTMMKKFSIAFCLFFWTTFLYSQNQTMNWFFGVNAGISFTTSPPSFLPGGQLNTYEGTSSASDNLGMLLFYSDGVSVIDRNHAQMPNGWNLGESSTSTQSCLIVPKPGSPMQYYLFTPPDEYSTDSLRYSIVDMTLNGGLGDVSVKNIALLAHPTEKLAAVYHSNGADIWLITHTFLNADFYSWLITSSGISNTPVISTVGSIYNGNSGNKVGYLKMSPCGNKLASAINHNDILELFNFNSLTGAVSNPIQLGTWPNTSGYGVYGLEFSPNGFNLYASLISPGIVIQFNLLAGNPAAIIASADTIGMSPNNFNGALQLGLDGKIYLAKHGDNFLACITAPNQLGNACNYVENYVSLSPSSCSLGLPGFFASWFCESSPKGINDYDATEQFTVYPNPANSTLSMVLLNAKQITVTNLLGELMMEKTFSPGIKGTFSLDVSSFSAGIYFIKAGNAVRKFVKE